MKRLQAAESLAEVWFWFIIIAYITTMLLAIITRWLVDEPPLFMLFMLFYFAFSLALCLGSWVNVSALGELAYATLLWLPFGMGVVLSNFQELMGYSDYPGSAELHATPQHIAYSCTLLSGCTLWTGLYLRERRKTATAKLLPYLLSSQTFQDSTANVYSVHTP